MSHIFVSYSRRDSKCAYKVQRKLEAQGYQIWIDKNDIDAGDPFPQRILEAISKASVFILLWSANSAGSPYVEAEIEEAINQRMQRKLPLIPVSLDKSDLHSKLGSINTLALNDCAMSDIEKLIYKLPQSIKEVLSRKLTNDDLSKVFLSDDESVELVSIPYLDSWYCEAILIAESKTDIVKHFEQDNPNVVLIPQFTGSTTGQAVQQAYKGLKSTLDGQAFVCLHIVPKQIGMITVDIDERGQTLDAINTTYEAMFKLVNGNRGLATVKLCTPMLAALSASIMYRFGDFWHFQVYHFDRKLTDYQLLFDSKDL